MYLSLCICKIYIFIYNRSKDIHMRYCKRVIALAEYYVKSLMLVQLFVTYRRKIKLYLRTCIMFSSQCIRNTVEIGVTVTGLRCSKLKG